MKWSVASLGPAVVLTANSATGTTPGDQIFVCTASQTLLVHVMRLSMHTASGTTG